MANDTVMRATRDAPRQSRSEWEARGLYRDWGNEAVTGGQEEVECCGNTVRSVILHFLYCCVPVAFLSRCDHKWYFAGVGDGWRDTSSYAGGHIQVDVPSPPSSTHRPSPQVPQSHNAPTVCDVGRPIPALPSIRTALSQHQPLTSRVRGLLASLQICSSLSQSCRALVISGGLWWFVVIPD